MKKVIFSLILSAAAAMAVTSCNEVGNTENNSASESSAAEVTTAPETIEETTAEKPTERVKDIQTGDDFNYEIIDGTAVITLYTGSAEEVEVPAEIEGAPVTKIGTYAFEAQYDITSVTLPESITLIAEGAFMDCSSLESINIPEAVGGIDRGAFVACTSLTEMTIPANVQYIREEAFTACEAMTSLTINNPDLAYENWGLEELPELTVYAEEGSAAAQWAEGMGKYSAQ